MHVFEVKNDDLLSALIQQADVAGVTDGAIVSLIGAVDRFTVSTMPAGDATADTLTEYDLPAEMSGTGEIVGGLVHIHAVMAVQGDRAISGHLHDAHVGTHFARAYVLPRA